MTKNWKDLSEDKQQSIEESFFLVEDKTNLFIDEHGRPYVQTPNGKMYCSSKKSYNYSVKN